MTHRVELIMQAVTTALTGLANTGPRVYRGRTYPIPVADQNALVIFQGDDIPTEESSFSKVRSALIVNIEIVVREVSKQIDETMNAIRKDIAVALSNPTLGLFFVESALENEVGEPAIYDAGDRPEGRLPIAWSVIYIMNRANPGSVGIFSDDFSEDFL